MEMPMGTYVLKTFEVIKRDATQTSDDTEVSAYFESGRHHRQIAAAVLAAFSTEGMMNHFGPQILGDAFAERDHWKTKIKRVCKGYGITVDFGTDPFRTIATAFDIRDTYAHAKTEEYKSEPGNATATVIEQIDAEFLNNLEGKLFSLKNSIDRHAAARNHDLGNFWVGNC